MRTIANLLLLAALAASLLPIRSQAQGILFVENDRVGVVTSTPSAPLDVNIGTNAPGLGNAVLRLERVGPVAFQLKNTNDSGFWQFSNAAGGSEFRISRSGTGVQEFRLTSSGDLTIQGDITSNGTTFVPDYVFEDGYRLMPLSELATFIATERHLPNVPGAEEIKRTGLNVTDMQMRLLEKIEELTLYTLEQQKTIEQLQAQIESVAHRTVPPTGQGAVQTGLTGDGR